MRKNYVLIDFENVQPDSLERLDHAHFKLFVFVGAHQGKLPLKFVASLQRLGDRAEYIQISGNGPDALDFHIAYYIGQLAAAEPAAYFHIISKDAGFDPLIQHLKTKKIFAGRSRAISEIPFVRASNSKSSAERIELILGKLRQLKAAKPRTVKTLASTIAALFQKQLSEKDVSGLIDELATRGYITVSDTKVTYAVS
jgi:PIN domain-containing protein